jgi:ribosomal protein L21E
MSDRKFEIGDRVKVVVQYNGFYGKTGKVINTGIIAQDNYLVEIEQGQWVIEASALEKIDE